MLKNKIYKIFLQSSLLGILLIGFFTSCNQELLEPQQDLENSEQVLYDSQMSEFAKNLASSLKELEFREFLKTEALKKFDGDYDILWQFVQNENIVVQKMHKRSEPYLKSLLQRFPGLNVSIPIHAEKWNTNSFTPLVAVIPLNFDEKKMKSIRAYDSSGNLHVIDTRNEPNYPVVVVGLNERVTFDINGNIINTFQGPISMDDEPLDDEPCVECDDPCIDCEPIGGGGGTSPGSGIPPCTYPARDNLKYEYLSGMKMVNIGQWESWVSGAPEIEVRVYVPQGTNFNQLGNIFTANYLEPNKRADIDNKWWNRNDPMFFWDNNVFGQTALISFIEHDPSPLNIRTITLGGSFGVEIFGVGTTIDLEVVFNLEDLDDVIGHTTINQFACPPEVDSRRHYAIGDFKFSLLSN